MADQLPAAPVPADVDLRGLEWMPLYGHRLFGSDFDSHADDVSFRAGLQLWWEAWNQVPAASLPNDEVVLCKLAGLGRDMKTWKRVRDRALHGFALCDDGRLYHGTLAKWALESWDRRRRERERKAKWRASQERRNDPGPQPGQPPPVPVSGTDDRTGEDKTGEDLKKKEAPPVAEPVDTAREPDDLTPPAHLSRAKAVPEDWQPSDETRRKLERSRPDLAPDVIDLRMVEFRAWCASNRKTTFNADALWLGFMVKTNVQQQHRADKSERTGLSAVLAGYAEAGSGG